MRGDRWSEALAVGSFAFAEKVKSELGAKSHASRSGTRQNEVLSAENTVLWNESVENARADGHSFDRRKE
jgi:hypothetical protein